MRKTIGMAAIGAVMAIGPLAGAGLASASVEGFLQEMDTPSATHEEQIAEGNSFCTALTSGRDQQLSGPAAAAIITNFSDYNASQGRAGSYGVRLIKTAVTELCPANKAFFMTAAQAYDALRGE